MELTLATEKNYSQYSIYDRICKIIINMSLLPTKTIHKYEHSQIDEARKIFEEDGQDINEVLKDIKYNPRTENIYCNTGCCANKKEESIFLIVHSDPPPRYIAAYCLKHLKEEIQVMEAVVQAQEEEDEQEKDYSCATIE